MKKTIIRVIVVMAATFLATLCLGTLLNSFIHKKQPSAPEIYKGILSDVTAVIDGQPLKISHVKHNSYLFLPASADLKELILKFPIMMRHKAVVIIGDKGKFEIKKACYSEKKAINIEEIADKNSAGAYVVNVKIGADKPEALNIMRGTAIPTIYINSKSENRNREYVDASKKNAVNANMVMVNADGSKAYNGNLKQIKARGNSTFWACEKKSYKIKLEEKSDLLGTGEKVKTWVLLANYFDPSGFHDKFFKDLASEMGMPYVASSNWVNLYYDGEYRGLYLLSEKISVNKTSVDITDLEEKYEKYNFGYNEDANASEGINKYGQKYWYIPNLTEPDDISGGYLIELNRDKPDEICGFKTKRRGYENLKDAKLEKGGGVNVKSPEKCGKAAMEFISEYYQEFEDAAFAQDENGLYTGINPHTGKHYYDYVDKMSLIKLMLMQQLGVSNDMFYASVYFYKDAGSKMYAGPIWDQDTTLGTGWGEYLSPSKTYVYMYIGDALANIPEFNESIRQYYCDVFAPLIANKLQPSGTLDEYETALSDNATMNFVIWPYIYVANPESEEHIWKDVDYSDIMLITRQWIKDRLAALDVMFDNDVK